MKYILTKDVLGGVPEIEITEADYLASKAARNALVNGFAAHHSARGISRAHQDWAQAQLLRRHFVQIAEQGIRSRICARQCDAEPTEQRAEKRK